MTSQTVYLYLSHFSNLGKILGKLIHNRPGNFLKKNQLLFPNYFRKNFLQHIL